MKFQIVLQFSEDILSFDEVIRLEEKLIDILDESQVDGHDKGMGEINYYVLTSDVEKCFKQISKLLLKEGILKYLKSPKVVKNV